MRPTLLPVLALAFAGCATVSPAPSAGLLSGTSASPASPATSARAVSGPSDPGALPPEYAPVFGPQGTSVRPGTQSSSARPTYEDYRRQELDRSWRPGSAVLQGYLGAAKLQEIRRNGGSVPPVDGSSESLSQYPIIGGGAQWKLAGRRVDFGLEGLFNIAWRSGGTAFAAGGGGLVVAVKVDLWMIDFYGGPFLSVPLGRRARVYGGLGPMMTFASYDQSGNGTVEAENSTGFGTGVYGRFGFEFEFRRGSYIGLGARYQDNTIDLGSSLGDLDVLGWQYYLSVSDGF